MLNWIKKSKGERGEADRTVMPGVYLLADHLDAALAAAEDLKALVVPLPALKPGMTMRSIEAQSADLATALDRVRALELMMIARLLQARKRAVPLQEFDSNLKPVILLFVGATAFLDETVAGLGDESRRTFSDGNVVTAFLRSRAMIAPDAIGLPGLARLDVSEDFAVAGAIPLGMLMDQIAQFLDKLELMFDLFADRRPADQNAARDVMPPAH